jgi:hypothetical protein
MISIKEFSDQFSERHDFDYDDSSFLSKKFSNIIFSSIPQAWVCPIYDFLTEIDSSKIISISQVMGFPVINYKKLSGNELSLLKKLENDVKAADLDLYNRLDAIILN